jgi:translation initiation factor IF-2
VLKTDGKKAVKKKRVYQVAKEFNISNEALIDFLLSQNIKVRNHMTPLTDEMYELVYQNFQQEEVETDRESDYRKRIQEKKQEEEARRQAVLHEIDEILERSKGEVFEPVKVVQRKIKKKKVTPVEEVPEEQPVEAKSEKAPEVEKPEKVKKVKEEKEEVLKTVEEKPETEKPKRHLKKRPKVEKKEEKVADKKEPEKEAKKKKRRRKRRRVEVAADEAAAEAPAHPKKKKRRKKKKPVVIDEKEIEASIKETLAKMSDTPKRRRRKKDKEIEEAVAEEENVIKTTEFTSVAELAHLMEVEASEVIQACLSLGLLVTINQRLDRDTILMVADEFEYDVKFLTEYGEEGVDEIEEEEEDPALLESRPPVVTIMGHVDHGKTSLLDYIRESNIIAGESGGITQHIGAYEVSLQDEKKITFLDTPGHEAFTAMRARGAQVTDIVILVVAADDDVMPQTIEAINHARAANVPMVVAINKIDKPNANPDLIKQKLSEKNILVEDWGGKVQSAEVSAKTGDGVDHLLEVVLLEAELLELKANPHGKVKAILVETRMEKGRGVVGTVLVQKGTLRVGDPFIAGQFHGRVRAMFDERNHAVDEAPPSMPVQITGFTGMPQAGDIFAVADSEQEAREVSLKRQQLTREQSFRRVRRLTLDQISKQIAEGKVKELSMIIKADVDGSLEAISDSLMELGKDEDVSVRVIHKGVGAITESDVLLAEASRAVIVGFHVEPTLQAKELAQKEDVDIRLYKVIYDIVTDVKLALSGLLEPEISEEVIASIEVREIFKASKIGMIAGCYVLSGKVVRNALARVIREEEVIHEGKIASLKRFKEDVKEVASGYECGITLEDFSDIEVGDQVEAYKIVETARTLE